MKVYSLSLRPWHSHSYPSTTIGCIMKSSTVIIISTFFLLSHGAPQTNKQEVAALWLADEENVGPAVEVEAEDESSSQSEESLPNVTEQFEDDSNNTITVYNEEPCLRGGGTCLPEIECPHGKLSSQKGLCPKQQGFGVECCHGLSLRETRCHMRGGQCSDMNTCSRAVVEDRAEDCPDDKVCCVLVRS